MLHDYRLFTLTYRQARLEELEPYAIAADEVGTRIAHLREALGWSEAFYLNTCNRVLFFFYEEASEPTPVETFQRALGLDPGAVLAPRFLQGEEAITHLYEVASSVDSMVVGEREILRQLRHSYVGCHESGNCGDHLRILMQGAVAVAKQVYHQTKIGQKPVSVVSLAAQRIRQQRLDAATARVVLVGAGQTNWLVSKFLRKQGFRHVTVFNRSTARAERLARTYPEGRALPLAALPDYAEGFDLLVAATGATEALVGPAEMGALLATEPPGDKVVVDLSVPHSIDAAVTEALDLTYIQIDDLRKLAEENLAFRTEEVREARKLIRVQLARFRENVQQRRVERALSEVTGEIRAVKDRALNEVFSRELAPLDEETRELIERMLHYMEKKCIGIPMRAARKAVVSEGALEGV